MAYTVTFEVNGFKFGFTGGVGNGDGIAVNPALHNIDDFGFIDALREAMEAYPTIHAALWFENEGAFYARSDKSDDELKRHLYSAPDSHLKEFIELGQRAQKQTYVAFTPTMQRYYTALIVEQERRRAKQAKEEEKKAAQPLNKGGYVYLIQSPTGYYKIGRTADPHNRMKTFGVQLPFEVEYVCVIEAKDMYALERQLHDRFAAKRVNGEWFTLDSADVDYVRFYPEVQS